MRTNCKLRVRLWLVCFGAFATGVMGQGTLQITFDGPPTIAVGSAITYQEYYESGFGFTPLYFDGFSRLGGGRSTRPENGSPYLAAALGQSLTFSRIDGGAFEFLSVDLAEYSTALPDAVTVQFIGYFANGTTITQTRKTDGIIDGTGPIVDFQTFAFGGWSGLTRVEIPTWGWSLDNVRVAGVPEPSCGALFGLGFGLFYLLRRRVA